MLRYCDDQKLLIHLPKQEGAGFEQDLVLFHVPVPVLWSHSHVLQSPQVVRPPWTDWPMMDVKITKHDRWFLATSLSNDMSMTYWYELFCIIVLFMNSNFIWITADCTYNIDQRIFHFPQGPLHSHWSRIYYHYCNVIFYFWFLVAYPGQLRNPNNFFSISKNTIKP